MKYCLKKKYHWFSFPSFDSYIIALENITKLWG